MPTKKELLSSNKNKSEICDFLGAASCDFLSIDYRSVLDEYEIYTLGHKQRDIVNESSLEQIEITDKDEFKGSILEKSKDYKEIIVAAIVIISIIILFTVINNIN